MAMLLTLISSSPYIELPQGWVGWLGWFGLLSVDIFLLWKWRRFNKPLRGQPGVHFPPWGAFVLLLLLTFAASLFGGIQLPAEGALPPPGVPADPKGSVVMLLAALPWMLAAGLLGPRPAAVLALIAGVLEAFWDTHNPFTPLELVLLSLLFSAAVNQPYRTLFFRLIRHPILIAACLALLCCVLFIVDISFMAQGILVNRLDYALTQVRGAVAAVGIELLVGGLLAEVIALAFPRVWGVQSEMVPSPAERSLQARFSYAIAPLAIIPLLVLIVGDWIVAGRAARQMLEARMVAAAEIVAENVPYYFEAGQNLITQLSANPDLYQTNGISMDKAALDQSKTETIRQILDRDIKNVPFFKQLFVVDARGELVVAYPDETLTGSLMPFEERAGIEAALLGVPFQTFAIPPEEGGSTALISFIKPLIDENQVLHGVLIGRSDLETNPFTRPLLTSLNNLAGIDGQGMLLDETGRVLAHSDPALVMSEYSVAIPESLADNEAAPFYDDAGPDGTRWIVHYRPAIGQPWSVLLTIPARRAQQLALTIAGPLLLIIAGLSIVTLVVLRLGLGVITSSLMNLAEEAEHIAQGKLDQPLPADGEDEVGQLRRAFEQMRISLKARLDELNRLLLVSQGVASSLEVEEAIKPVLEAALSTGASSARVVLTPAVLSELGSHSPAPLSFGLGPSTNHYTWLDEQILSFTHDQERLVLSSLTRPRLLTLTGNALRPESLSAIALRHENLYYGALWVAHDQFHRFSEEELRFLVTLASQAALGTANARLFSNAEIGRQRLAAILDSSPDPVLVTDQRDHLLLANPAAWQALNLGNISDEGQPIERVIPQKELIDLLRSSATGTQSIELTLADGQIFLATATPVLAEDQHVGRVCVLRDVTRFKELDSLKSEFVSTVSHDLRSPLTLMRGYATMLEMVGPLNDQQTGYVRKIVGGVESMSRLVNNLLDLGRIEAGVGLQLEMVPVHDIIERVAGALQLQATQKRLQLVTEIPQDTIPLIEADQALLQQALQNLVDNAIKYTRPEGKVTVRVQARPGRMVFEVSDTGIGISPMDQPRLFEKFYRGAKQGPKDQRGTGLGLAIVKSIAERHGGQVWVESQLGKGSTFYLAIPLRQPILKQEIQF